MKTQLIVLLGFALCTSCKEDISPTVSSKTSPPTADFELPADVYCKEVMQVVNHSKAVTYEWYWGDGSTSTGSNPTHVYVNAGTYRVLFRARSAAGTDTISKVIRINYFALPWSKVNTITGSYRGKMFYNFVHYSAIPGPASYSWQRDTVIQITAVDRRSVLMAGVPMAYNCDSEASCGDWHGHLPNRSNYTFYSGYGLRQYYQLQKEQSGDSIYWVNSSDNGQSYSYYQFFGKRQ